MIDTLLNIGCTLDWITPSVAFIKDFLNGPVSDFGVLANPVWGRKEIKKLLRRHGIQVWGLMYDFNGGVLMFTVHRQNAEFAYYILRNSGVPILYLPNEVADSFLAWEDSWIDGTD